MKCQGGHAVRLRQGTALGLLLFVLYLLYWPKWGHRDPVDFLDRIGQEMRGRLPHRMALASGQCTSEVGTEPQSSHRPIWVAPRIAEVPSGRNEFASPVEPASAGPIPTEFPMEPSPVLTSIYETEPVRDPMVAPVSFEEPVSHSGSSPARASTGIIDNQLGTNTQAELSRPVTASPSVPDERLDLASLPPLPPISEYASGAMLPDLPMATRVDLTDASSGAPVATLMVRSVGRSDSAISNSHRAVARAGANQSGPMSDTHGAHPVRPDVGLSQGPSSPGDRRARQTQKPLPTDSPETYCQVLGQHFFAPMVIDVCNMELDQVVPELATRFRQQIEGLELLRGRITARISAANGPELLQRLVEPAGLTVTQGPRGVYRIQPAADCVEKSSERYAAADEPDCGTPRRLPVPEESQDAKVAHLQVREPSHSIAMVHYVDKAPSVTNSAAASTEIGSVPNYHAQTSIGDSSVEQRAREWMQQGKLAESIELLSDAIANSPEQPRLLVLLAQAYHVEGNLQAAQTAIEKALSFDRKDAAANETMGLILLARGQENRGRHYIQQAEFYRKRRGPR